MPTTAENLAAEIMQNRRILLWIGAGNSVTAGIPADIPDANGLAFKLAEIHFGNPAAVRENMGNDFRLSELARAIGKVRIRQLILQQPWPDLDVALSHRAIAALTIEGFLIEIVTINYDPLLEKGLKELHLDSQVVCSAATVGLLRAGSCTVIKAHGCPYTDGNADNLIMLEDELRNPPAWLLTFLRGKLQGRTFVYVGFAGNARYVWNSITTVVAELGGHPGASYAVDVETHEDVFEGGAPLGEFYRHSNVLRENYCSEGSNKFFLDVSNIVFRRIALDELDKGLLRAADYGEVDDTVLRAVLNDMSFDVIRTLSRKLLSLSKEKKLRVRDACISHVFMWLLIFSSKGILEDASYRPVLTPPYRPGPNSTSTDPIMFFDGLGLDIDVCVGKIRSFAATTSFKDTFQLRTDPRWYAVIVNCLGNVSAANLGIIPEESDSVVAGYDPIVCIDEHSLRNNIQTLPDLFRR